jgi:SAM-dependent MidA family methyltransferase
MKPQLSLPTNEAIELSLSLISNLRLMIEQNGPISLYEYMNQVLYAPGLGYYSAGSHKIGPQGDFITAPEISPVFAACLAKQCAQVLAELDQPIILELGAGLGTLAVDLLLNLEQSNSLPVEYWILEPSAELRQRQTLQCQARCPHLINRIKWLDTLPQQDFNGIILGNEVIDALPVSCFKIKHSQAIEMGVDFINQKFQWAELDSNNLKLQSKLETIQRDHGPLPEQYCSEVNLMLPEWLSSISAHLRTGIMLWIDYGYPRASYYHPSRSSGTLMCYYRHHAHSDPFLYPGLQDITAHVDFTALAEAGISAGFELSGYISQAMFLINCGLEQIIQTTKLDISEQTKLKKLISPQQMGENFKVMALSRNISLDLLGFTYMDERHRL